MLNLIFTPRALRSEDEYMRTMYILRTADRPRILENFERSYLGNGSSDPLHVWFYGTVFGGGRVVIGRAHARAGRLAGQAELIQSCIQSSNILEFA